MPRVESSAILRLNYDPESRTLFVIFVDGDVYAYFDVPEEAYDAFLVAPSKGRYFADEIRGRYEFHKVER